MRYIPTYDESVEDAKFLLEGNVNKVRCDTCGYRLAWRNEEEKKKFQGCICGKDPSWYDDSLQYLTYRDIVEVYSLLFRNFFAEYVFTRFFDEIKARQLRNKIILKEKHDRLQKDHEKRQLEEADK